MTVKYIYVTRFCENLSILLLGGIPIVRGLQIVAEIMNNEIYEEIVLKAADEVRSGGNISTVLSQHKEIPPIMARMVKVGEDSGKLTEILKKIAHFYQQEVDRMVKNITVMIEPVLIVVLGLGVAVMAFGILMPIYNIVGQM